MGRTAYWKGARAGLASPHWAMRAAAPCTWLLRPAASNGESPSPPPPERRALSGSGPLELQIGAVGLDADRERLFLDPVLVAQELLLVTRERQDDAVGELEPLLAAEAVDLVDQVADAALELELRVQGQVERDGEAVLARDGPAFLAAALDEHFLRRQLVAVDTEAPFAELLELPRLERGPDRAELLSELRAQHREVRLHSQLARVDLAELDTLHAQLLGDLGGVVGDGIGALDDETAQRLTELDPRLRARLAAELDHTADLGHLGEQRLVGLRELRPPREVDRFRPLEHERAPKTVGQERHRGRDDPQRLDDRPPESLERLGLTVPEPPSRAADVPVRKIVDERFEEARQRRRLVALVRGLGGAHQPPRARD